jgi:hypothetical protein
MRASGGWALLSFIALTGAAPSLHGQAAAGDRHASVAARWGPRPLPPSLAATARRPSLAATSDSTRRRPFFLPRRGEGPAFWIGLGAGVALSPLLWCEGSGCSTLNKVNTSWLLGVAGAVSGLLLKRTL